MATLAPHRAPGPDFLKALFDNGVPRDFSIRLWDGTRLDADRPRPRFILVFRHPDALRALLQAHSDLRVAECYLRGELRIEGDVEAAIAFGQRLLARPRGVVEKLRFGWTGLRLASTLSDGTSREARLHGRRHSRERDRAAVRHHYDVSNDFYALWLDRAMVYSCAYFEHEHDDLDTAQRQKLDYVCRKLRLREGERLLDIGCGWGGLILHAVRRYGVIATGITVSAAQADLARKRIRAAGVSGRCTVDVCDYREMTAERPFDKLVSVGMFEHVGRERMDIFFRRAFALLRPGGILLNHAIAGNVGNGARSEFSDRYVFPDHDLVPIGATLTAAEQAGFEVRDVESLREHYMRTLRLWGAGLERYREQATAAADEVTWRAWRLMMAGAAHAFQTGAMNLYQSLLLRPEHDVSGLPATRSDWYGEEGEDNGEELTGRRIWRGG